MCFFKIYLYIIFALHLILYCPPLLNNGQSNNGARAKGYEARFNSTHNKIGKNNVTLRFSMSTETSQIEILKTDSITLLTYKLSTGSISSWIVILSFRTCPCYCFKLNAKTISKICWSPQFWQPGEKWLPTLIIKYICDKDMYTDTHSLSHSPSHTEGLFCLHKCHLLFYPSESPPVCLPSGTPSTNAQFFRLAMSPASLGDSRTAQVLQWIMASFR